MDFVLDSSSLINLIRGACLDEVTKLSKNNFHIGNIVKDECYKVQAEKDIIEEMLNNNKILLITPDVSITDFEKMKEKHKVGSGETESIIHCSNNGYSLICDDLKARTSAAKELGKNKVNGSIFLLKECVSQKIITCTEAEGIFLLMKRQGGFLPNLRSGYFC